MKSRAIGLFFLIVFILSPSVHLLGTSASAASREEVVLKLETTRNVSGFRVGDRSTDEGGCWRFVNAVCVRVFGTGIPSGTGGKYRLTHAGSSNDWNLVDKTYNGATATNNNIVALLKQANPGDIIQYRNSLTKPQHTAIVFDVTNNSITIYDQTTPNGVQLNQYLWTNVVGKSGLGIFDLADTSHGISLYSYSGYQRNTGNELNFSIKGHSNITLNTARVDASCSYTGTRPSSVGVYLGTSSSNMIKKDSDIVSFSKNPFDIWYNLTGLSPGTIYYYQFYAVVDGREIKSETRHFTTTGSSNEGSGGPVGGGGSSNGSDGNGVISDSLNLSVKGHSNITSTTARVDASCFYTGTRPSSVGLYLGTSTGNMRILDSDSINFSKNPFDIWYDLTGLASGTQYFYQFYAVVGGQEIRSETRNFTTVSTSPAWSSWTSSPTPPASATETEIRYRTRLRETTTASTPTLPGWEESGSNGATTGAWSAWTTTPIAASSSLEVETRTRQETTYKTVYNYYHYTYTYNGQRYTTFSKNPGGGITPTLRTRQTDSPLPFYTTHSGHSAFGIRSDWWYRVDINSTSAPGGSFETRVASGTTNITEYRSRSIGGTWNFWRWGSWSGWVESGTVPVATADMQVEAEYRYRIG